MSDRLRFTKLCILIVPVILGCASADSQSREVPAHVREPVLPPVRPDDNTVDAAVPDASSEETYDDVERLVDRLNRMIADRNYGSWREQLSESYIETFSDPEVLGELERAAVLRRSGIRLRTLSDYFHHVVVPSRQDARMEELQSDGERTVLALSEVQGRTVVLYRFIWEEEEWKVAPF